MFFTYTRITLLLPLVIISPLHNHNQDVGNISVWDHFLSIWRHFLTWINLIASRLWDKNWRKKVRLIHRCIRYTHSFSSPELFQSLLVVCPSVCMSTIAYKPSYGRSIKSSRTWYKSFKSLRTGCSPNKGSWTFQIVHQLHEHFFARVLVKCSGIPVVY